MASNGSNGNAPAVNGHAYPIEDHTYDVVVVGAGGAGLRHFVWDLGYGFKANEREALTWGALIGGIALTVLVWILAYTVGGGR